MHKISIPESAKQVVQGRLGRARKYARLDPRRTALLVIDMQNAFLMPGMGFGLPTGLEMIPKINRIASSLRALGGTVVWVQVNFSHERASWSTWFDHHMSPAAREQMIAALSPGHPGFEVHAELVKRPEDLVVHKTRFSAFVQGSSNLHDQLRQRRIEGVIVTGTVTNTCCEGTARDAMQLNYKTVFVSDGNACRTDAEHNATLVSMLQTFAEVLDTEELIALLKQSASQPVAT